MGILYLKEPNRTVFTYMVAGEPMPLCKVLDDNGPGVWDDYKRDRFIYIQNIKNQHEKYFEQCCFEEGAINPRQFIDGPMILEVRFFMKLRDRHKKQKQVEEEYKGGMPTAPRESTPPIFSLFNFIDQALQGIVYRKDCTITSVKLNKRYDKIPRTEIQVTRLKL